MKRQGVNGEFPETPSFIHEMIVAEVDKQVHKKGETVSMADHKKRSYKSFTRAAAGVRKEVHLTLAKFLYFCVVVVSNAVVWHILGKLVVNLREKTVTSHYFSSSSIRSNTI